ncbi:hypothetical protein ACMV5I_15165 [Serratia sp. T13T92]|uniref:hypothetical protein n=1 Tax=Serratia sp. T13T92 TaxID=3397496 RepID=UPI0039E111F3
MKIIPSAALAISLSLFSGYPMAIDDTIEFIGDINNNICAVSVNDDNSKCDFRTGIQHEKNDIAGGASFFLSITQDENCNLTGKTGSVRLTTMRGTFQLE